MGKLLFFPAGVENSSESFCSLRLHSDRDLPWVRYMLSAGPVSKGPLDPISEVSQTDDFCLLSAALAGEPEGSWNGAIRISVEFLTSSTLRSGQEKPAAQSGNASFVAPQVGELWSPANRFV